LGRFNLHPSPAVPRNAFVPLQLLQTKLGQAGRINALLVGGGEASTWQERLKQHLTLEDWGLRLHSPESRTQDLFEKLDRNRDGKLTPNEWRRRVSESFIQAARSQDNNLERSGIAAFYRSHHNYLSLESRQMLLEPAAAEAAAAAAK